MNPYFSNYIKITGSKKNSIFICVSMIVGAKNYCPLHDYDVIEKNDEPEAK